MGNVRLYGSTSGYTELAAPAVAPDGVLTLPAVAGTLATTADVAAIVPGKILQVVTTTYSTEVSTTTASWVTTGVTATITPASASSKILVLVHTGAELSGGNAAGAFSVFRGTVAGTNLGDSVRGMSQHYIVSATGYRGSVSFNYLDSPSTASAQTYTLGMRLSSSGGPLYSSRQSSVSSMTLMEVAA